MCELVKQQVQTYACIIVNTTSSEHFRFHSKEGLFFYPY